MGQRFENKDQARSWVWDQLEEHGIARFPFPPHGRIPNFEGAREAASRLVSLPVIRKASCLKINPDAPQRHVREFALRQGITTLVPTPRLRSGFEVLDPSDIPDDSIENAASLSRMDDWATETPLSEIPSPDAIVTGSVAVTRCGKRCGKGEGYSDLEFALLLEIGMDPVPVLTTVHPIQIVDDFPSDRHDLPLSTVVTPDEHIRIENPPAGPRGIDWSMLDEDDLDEMPVLREVRDRFR